MAFSEGKEGHTSQQPKVSVGLKRPNIRGEIFLLSALTYNGDSHETLDRVHVKYFLPKCALRFNTVAIFVQKVA